MIYGGILVNSKSYLKNLKTGDKFLILAILIGSLLGPLLPFLANLPTNRQTNNLAVVISISGEEKGRFMLADIPQEGKFVEFAGPIGIHKIEMRPEGVRVFAPSTDPQKLCEKTGWLKSPGPAIVCIPNRLIVQLLATDAPQIDGITE